MEPLEASRPAAKENGGTFVPVSSATKVQDVIRNPVFEGYGRLIFPADRAIGSGLTLELDIYGALGMELTGDNIAVKLSTGAPSAFPRKGEHG